MIFHLHSLPIHLLVPWGIIKQLREAPLARRIEMLVRLRGGYLLPASVTKVLFALCAGHLGERKNPQKKNRSHH